jgi:hypothetical protein
VIHFTPEAEVVMEHLADNPGYKVKRKKVVKALKLLRDAGPSYPGLHSHKYQSLHGPGGEDVFESYVENHTPGAWRVWWIYGPGSDEITIVSVGPHPD